MQDNNNNNNINNNELINDGRFNAMAFRGAFEQLYNH